MERANHPEVERFINEYLDEKIHCRNEKIRNIKKMIFDKQEFVAGVFSAKNSFSMMSFVQKPRPLLRKEQ